MSTTFVPSTIDVKSRLTKLGHAQMQALSKLSGVPFTTIWKIREGETGNPGIETVRKFLPHIESAKAA